MINKKRWEKFINRWHLLKKILTLFIDSGTRHGKLDILKSGKVYSSTISMFHLVPELF